MILNVVKNTVRSKYADGWPTLVEAFTSASRAEPGCISFDWYRSADDPNVWALIEVFRDDDAGRAHVESAHFAEASEGLRRWLAAVPEIIHVEVAGDSWDRVSEGQG